MNKVPVAKDNKGNELYPGDRVYIFDLDDIMNREDEYIPFNKCLKIDKINENGILESFGFKIGNNFDNEQYYFLKY